MGVGGQWRIQHGGGWVGGERGHEIGDTLCFRGGPRHYLNYVKTHFQVRCVWESVGGNGTIWLPWGLGPSRALVGPRLLGSWRGSGNAMKCAQSWLCALPGLLLRALGEGLGLILWGGNFPGFTGSGWAVCWFWANPSPFLLPNPQRNEAKAPLNPKAPSWTF